MSSSPDHAALRGPVGVVGLGLIGGSAARALVLAGVPVLGVATSDVDRRLAACAGVRVVPDVATLADALPAGAIVLLAVPLGALAPVCDTLLPRLHPDVLALHAAGLQAPASTALDAAARARVLGTHPLAGSHAAGFAASRAHLFHEAVVSAEVRASVAERCTIEALWRVLGAARVEWHDAEAHDRTMAWVSHLPQLAAVALAAALDGADVPASAGGPGLRGATRLAASPLGVWDDVLRAAPAETARALDALIAEATALRAALARRDDGQHGGAEAPARAPRVPRLHGMWERARRWRTAGAEGSHAGR
jgi:prephenate dehydrogenase